MKEYMTSHRSGLILKSALSALLLGVLCACASGPTGPTITVMPAKGKPFDVFEQDDQACRQFASTNSKDTSNTAIKQAATSAAVGTALGAAAGAVIGGGSHANVGTGAGVGLLGGALVGAIGANSKDSQSQTQYNIAYQQCMYAKGNQVPSVR